MQDVFLACGISAPVRVEHEGGTASWLAGTQAVPRVQGQGLPLSRTYGPIRVFFKPLEADNQKASLANLSLKLLLFSHLEHALAWGPSSLNCVAMSILLHVSLCT